MNKKNDTNNNKKNTSKRYYYVLHECFFIFFFQKSFRFFFVCAFSAFTGKTLRFQGQCRVDFTSERVENPTRRGKNSIAVRVTISPRCSLLNGLPPFPSSTHHSQWVATAFGNRFEHGILVETFIL